MENIDFSIGNDKISVVVFYPPVKKDKYQTILFVHGWISEKERSYQYAKALNKLGYLCFLFDLPGHGQSEGNINSFTSKDFLNAVIEIYDYLLNLDEVDKNSISAIGSSFGCYLVAMLSGKRKLKNLILRAPADYPNEDFKKIHTLSGGGQPYVMSWRELPKQPNETYALEALNKFDGDVLIIESELDDHIPHQTVENYMIAVKEKSKLTHVLMKEAPHSIKEGRFRDEVERILIKWFKDKI